MPHWSWEHLKFHIWFHILNTICAVRQCDFRHASFLIFVLTVLCKLCNLFQTMCYLCHFNCSMWKSMTMLKMELSTHYKSTLAMWNARIKKEYYIYLEVIIQLLQNLGWVVVLVYELADRSCGPGLFVPQPSLNCHYTHLYHIICSFSLSSQLRS